MPLHIADEVYPAHSLDKLVCLLDLAVPLALLGAVGKQADPRRLDPKHLACIEVPHDGELHQDRRGAIDRGAGIHQDPRRILAGKDGRNARTGHALKHAPLQKRRAHRRAGIAGTEYAFRMPRLHQIHRDYYRTAGLLTNRTDRMLVHPDYIGGIHKLNAGISLVNASLQKPALHGLPGTDQQILVVAAETPKRLDHAAYSRGGGMVPPHHIHGYANLRGGHPRRLHESGLELCLLLDLENLLAVVVAAGGADTVGEAGLAAVGAGMGLKTTITNLGLALADTHLGLLALLNSHCFLTP